MDAAANILRRGGLVVYPTDTLYGLGALVANEAAVDRVFDAKNRPRNQPLSIAVSRPTEISRYAVVTPLARCLFPLLPGPLTLILKRRKTVPDVVTGGDPSVGVRIPNNPTCLGLLAAVGPLTATSANRHGAPDPRTLEAARAQLGDRADYYLPSSTPLLGAASTVLDARGRTPIILRQGALSESRIRALLPD